MSSSDDRARLAFVDALDEIDSALAIAVPTGASKIRPRTAEYYAASMVLIRLAALFDNAHFSPFLGAVSEPTRRAIATMRNIAAHAGSQQMDGSVLRRTLTVDMPPLMGGLREAASEHGDVPATTE